MPRQVPLTTLLSWTWVAFTIEADNAYEAAGSERMGRLFRISLPMWTNGLRCIDDEGVTVDDVRASARAACNIGGLERWGWISVGNVGSKPRDGYGSHRGVKGDTVLRPTRAGVSARSLWPEVVARTEERWVTRFGAGAVDSLRQALRPLAGPMPWSPPEVNPPNGFRTVLVDGATDGTDGTDVGRPLVALLGQALTTLTLDHERDAAVSLPLGANVLRAVDDEVVRIRDLPRRAGVSKAAIAMALTYLKRWGMVTPERDRSVLLTADGRDALDDYRALAARPKDNALRAVLEGIVSRREALSAGLVPPEGCWRGQKPFLAQTQRVLSDPTGALPWHPMVLHRGAYPDGA